MNINDIDISLSLGQLFWKNQFRIIIVFIILSLMFPVLTIIMSCTPLIWNIEIIFCMVCANILSLIMFVFALYLIIKDRLNKKKVFLWIEDAIKLKAYSKSIGQAGLFFLHKGIKIQVDFSINNVPYTRYSTLKNFFGRDVYLASLIKYSNREIDILYSPKYDQVMILKDQKI